MATTLDAVRARWAQDEAARLAESDQLLAAAGALVIDRDADSLRAAFARIAGPR